MMKTKKDLIDFLYNDSGKARVIRFKKEILESNGFTEEINNAIQQCNDIGLHEISFSEKLRAYCKDKVYLPLCKTCGNEYIRWSNKHQAWSKFCCQKCVQNSPEVKEKMLDGQKNIDWASTIKKRENTLLEAIGVPYYSQTEEAKKKFTERTKEFWSDDSRKETAISRRIETNRERYGVDHGSQSAEIRKKMDVSLKKYHESISEEEKQKNIQKYRESRLSPISFNALISIEQMTDLYINKRMSVLSISKLLECSEGSVVFAIKSLGIEYDSNRTSITSDKEIELFEFVKSIDSRTISTYKDGKHIDVYIPELKIGFEFNGVYWHSEAKKDKQYHATKVDYFYSRGIRYVQIWEDDWDHKRDVVERFIKNLLGFNPRIGARKTTIKELTQKEFDTFMEANHMQGTTSCGIRIGLMHDGKIVSAIGFREIAKNTKSISDGNGIDLVRFANLNVTGAFTKILCYFKSKFNYDYIISFGDLEIINRYSNVYTKNGFVEVERIDTDYKYYNYRTGKREHKFGYRKSNFLKLGMQIDGKTERELALEYRLLRCYDSGKIKYLLKM